LEKNNFFVVFSVDVDEDDVDKAFISKDKHYNWRGLEEGIPLIKKSLNGYHDHQGSKIKYTWFLRCDRQIENLYGESDYLLNRYINVWRDLNNNGDEIGWHFHPYDHERDVLDNYNQLVQDARDSFNMINEHGFNILSSRIGRSYCSNELIDEFDKIGLKVDSTALPGRKRFDEVNSFDWETTEEIPYFPSKNDYRISGKDVYSILEVPFSMILTRASYDKKEIKRYCNLSYRHECIREDLEKYIIEKNLLVTILHPYEVLKGKTHPLLSYDIGEVNRNLEFIHEICERCNKKIIYINILQILHLFNIDIN
jgi:hypothetical protein